MVHSLSFEEVYAYAKKSVDYFIAKHAYDFPFDQKEEISQNAMLRVWKAYQDINPEIGWKSFVQLHCRGAVLDYIKLGSFEDGFSRATEHDHLSQRITIESSDGDTLSVEETAALFGVYFDHHRIEKAFEPQWPLLSRLAGFDEDLHIVAKVLLGFTQEEIADQFGHGQGFSISRERISQKIREFFSRLDSPEFYNDRFTTQAIFALGMGQMFNQPDVDNGFGWDLPVIEIENIESFKRAQTIYSPTLFDFSEAEAI